MTRLRVDAFCAPARHCPRLKFREISRPMSRATITSLSPTHLRIARAVARFERQQEPAFVPDLVRALGLAGESSLAPTLRLMARNGYLALQGGGAQGRSRLVRLTAKCRAALSLGGLPLLGSIPAGPLAEALAEPETVLDERDLLAFRDGDFLLRVRGESMTGDGILDGDKVLLRPDVEAHDGEIAAVLVGDAHEATLKRVFRKGDRVILRASHPAYPDLTVPADAVKIAGVFRGLIRDGAR
jgi:repressor LexA